LAAASSVSADRKAVGQIDYRPLWSSTRQRTCQPIGKPLARSTLGVDHRAATVLVSADRKAVGQIDYRPLWSSTRQRTCQPIG